MADELPLGFSMGPSEVESLAGPIFTKQEVNVSGEKLLLVTRNFGSGRELRDAYLYRFAMGSWDLIAFRKTSSAQLSLTVSAGVVSVTTKTGKVVMSIPIDSIRPSFEPG